MPSIQCTMSPFLSSMLHAADTLLTARSRSIPNYVNIKKFERLFFYFLAPPPSAYL